MAKKKAPRRWLARWAAAAGCLALGAAAGFGAYMVQPRTYTATTAVLVLPTFAGYESDVSGSATNSAVAIETEAELAHSASVAASAAGQLGGRMTPGELLSATTVSVPTNSTVLQIQVVADEAELARDASAAVADVYLQRRVDAAKAQNEGVVETLNTSKSTLTQRLQENAAALQSVGANDVGGRALLESERGVLVSQIADINSRLVSLQSGVTTGGEVITEAATPSRPTSPNLWINLGAGLIVGGTAAAGLLLLLDRRDRLHAQQSSRMAAARSLGSLGVGADPAAELARNKAAAVSRICTEIDEFPGAPGPTVCVGLGDPELVTGLVAMLNTSWAGDRGGSVLVIPNSTGLASTVVPHGAGLADALRTDRPVTDVLERRPGAATAVLGPGLGTSALAPSVMRSRLSSLWEDLEHEIGGVVIDLLPPLGTVEAQSILRTAGRIVIVNTAEAPEGDEIAAVFEDLDYLALSHLIVGAIEARPETAEERADLEPAGVQQRPAETKPAVSVPAPARGGLLRRAKSPKAADRPAAAAPPEASAENRDTGDSATDAAPVRTGRGE